MLFKESTAKVFLISDVPYELLSHKHATKERNRPVCSAENSALWVRKLQIKVYPNANKLFHFFGTCLVLPCCIAWELSVVNPLVLSYPSRFAAFLVHLGSACALAQVIGFQGGQKGCSSVQHPYNLLTLFSSPKENIIASSTFCSISVPMIWPMCKCCFLPSRSHPSIPIRWFRSFINWPGALLNDAQFPVCSCICTDPLVHTWEKCVPQTWQNYHWNCLSVSHQGDGWNSGNC